MNARRSLVGLLVGGVSLAAMAGPASPQEPAAKPASPRAGVAASVIYLDPQTGALVKEPPPGTAPLQLSPAEHDALSTSDQGLVEVPSPVPGGGVRVDLQGRFLSPVFATIDADGKLKMQHLRGR